MEEKKVNCFSGEKCCLKECSKKLIEKDEVVILATDRNLLNKIENYKNKEKIKANWKPSNKTCFHSECFSKLEEESEKKGRGKERMISEERKMVDLCKQMEERFDSEQVFQGKMDRIAEIIKNSSHLVVFTGAGISVSAGISTYRGTDGIDTKSELGQEEEEAEEVQYTKLNPTLAHKALGRLYEIGTLKHVITQNVDHLHNKTTIPNESISALHGDVFVEYCEGCLVEYERDYEVDLYSTNWHVSPFFLFLLFVFSENEPSFSGSFKESWYVKCKTCKLNHFTGRTCEDGKCGKRLRDTIINCNVPSLKLSKFVSRSKIFFKMNKKKKSEIF